MSYSERSLGRYLYCHIKRLMSIPNTLVTSFFPPNINALITDFQMSSFISEMSRRWPKSFEVFNKEDTPK